MQNRSGMPVDRCQRLKKRVLGGLLWTVGVVGLVTTASGQTDAEPGMPDRPNIVLILADDLGYGDLGCYNPESRIPTPHLDAMAGRGMRFTDAHSPCTVCTPTRYSVLTGQMAFRIPRGGTVFTGAGGPCLIEDQRLTLPEMLRERDYATACIGKWHVGLTFRDPAGEAIDQGGLEAVQRIDFGRPIEGGPLDHGFDLFWGTACCPTTDWLYAWIENDRIPLPPGQPLNRDKLPRHPYGNDCRPGLVATDFDLETVDLDLLDRSRQFISRHVRENPDQPFFLYHCTQGVHLPSFPAAPFQGVTGMGPHADFIAELDHVAGELIRVLEQHQVADNTIVIFTSDNGPEIAPVHFMRKDQAHDPARPWRGIKRDNWEGGHRVPLLVQWPDRIEPGCVSNQLISLTDLMATLAAVIGYDLPQQAAEDSHDMLPVWLAGSRADLPAVRDYLLMQGFGGRRTLAIRQANWKLLNHRGSGGNRYDQHRLLQEYRLADSDPDAGGQLYNLQDDPGETTNLWNVHPERVRQLQMMLQRSIEQGRSAPDR